MAKSNYLYRACFKPDSLDMLTGLTASDRMSGQGLGYAQVWLKENTKGSPNCIVNELICSRLGSILGLPIPPFAITHAADGRPFFSSLDFNHARATLPPVIPETCIEHLPELCAGVLVFDVWIANEDRHDMNLLVDVSVKPRAMHVFDQDQALLGGCMYKSTDRLDKLRSHLGVSGGEMGGNRHVFLDYIANADLLTPWIRNIRDIPLYMIRDTCEFARRELDLSQDTVQRCMEFLIFRRDRLWQIILEHRQEFTAVPENGWPKDLFNDQ